MSQQIKATYHRGAFVPQTPCNLPEDAEVELIIQYPYILSSEVTESNERQHILKTIVERMQQNPLPVEMPRLTRDSLHERR